MKKYKCFLFLILLVLLFLLLILIFVEIKQNNTHKKTSLKSPKLVRTFHKNRSFIIDVTKCDAKILSLSIQCNSLLQRQYLITNKDCSRCKEDSIIYFHTIWEIKKESNDFQFRVLNLNLMSYLVTQVFIYYFKLKWF